MTRSICLILIAWLMAFVCLAQTQSTPPDARGVVRLRARIKVDESSRGLSRKRFFLIKGSIEQNKSVIETIQQRPVISRDCYYRNAGASEALIKWLKESDCESVYCREIQPDDIEGPGSVPEFSTALATGEKEFGKRQVARTWLTVNLPEKLRNGFYESRRNDIEALIKQAEAISGAKVLSVMTDRNGTAYFTDLELGTYTLTNLLGVEIGTSSAVWTCELQVKAGDLANEKPFLISNRKDKNVKCVAVEKPLPVCESLAK